jgi:hypothetical protein
LERFVEAQARAVGPREITLPIVALAMVALGVLAQAAETVSVALIVVGSGMFFVGMLLPTLTEFQIGPSGFSAKLRERDQEVRAALEPHSDNLLQTAALIAGSPEKGRELLDQALVETYLRWRQAKQEGPADAVRRRLDLLAGSSGQAPPQATEPGA